MEKVKRFLQSKEMGTRSLIFACIVSMSMFCFILIADAATVKDMHEKMIYPVVRVTCGNSGGSGTVIYSESDGDKWSSYVLTNHHVISSAIDVIEEWDPDLQKEVKKEKRSTVYVEIFKYKNISIPIGTLKVEANIVIYNKAEDMALLKLSMEDAVTYVATLMPRNKLDSIHVFDGTVVVGCSLLFPPLPTSGEITRQNFQVDSLPFNMSSSQIIYGNSGGAMFTSDGRLIGIPSLVALAGWSTPITHMGLFIPIERIYDWLIKEHYDFIFNPEKKEKECLELREKEIKAKTKKE